MTCNITGKPCPQPVVCTMTLHDERLPAELRTHDGCDEHMWAYVQHTYLRRMGLHVCEPGVDC